MNNNQDQEKDNTEKVEEGCACGGGCSCQEARSEDIVMELEKKVEELKTQNEEYLNGWKRARADYLNFRNEESDRVAGLADLAREQAAVQILPLLDNFNLVESKLPEKLKTDPNVAGIIQLKTQLLDVLKSYGVEEVASLGEKFDPNVHEVLQEVEAKGQEPGIVVEEIKKGYKINGRLLRPAKVIVSK
jgi:molecular chaperone GrpE